MSNGMEKYRLVVVEEQCSGIGGMHGLEMDLSLLL